MDMYVDVRINRIGNNESNGGRKAMKKTEFTLTDFDGFQWWRTTVSVSGLENIMMFVKVNNFNDLLFLYHLESIGAVQLEETNQIIEI